MLTILRQCRVFDPEEQALVDILFADGKIAAIQPNLPHIDLPGTVELDGRGRVTVPGFVDGHVHLIGGGGSTGPHTRGPELMLSEFTTSGITTAVGVLGADGLTRHLMSLIAKARALEHEGLSTYVYLGSYDVPLPTITGCLKSDLMLVDKAIGAGEVAIADPRSSQPTREELIRIGAEVAVAGRLTGRGGVVNVHVGPGKRGLDLVLEAIEHSDLPIATFLPTHCNRNANILEQAATWGLMGGAIDLSTHRAHPDTVPCPDAIHYLLDKGVPLDRISMSTDAGGVFPHLVDDQGRPAMARWEPHLLHDEFVAIAQAFDLTTALQVASTNPARHLGLFPRKGTLQVGADADLLCLREDLSVEAAVCRGRLMIEDGVPLVRGVFDQSV